MWRSVKFGVVRGVLQWQTRQGEWIPVHSLPSGDCQRCTQRGSPGGCHWGFNAPIGPGRKTPPLGQGPGGGGGGGACDTATLLADLANRWARACNVDDPYTPDESAPVRPRTRAQYGSRLRALASYAARTSPSSIAEGLAGIVAERARMPGGP